MRKQNREKEYLQFGIIINRDGYSLDFIRCLWRTSNFKTLQVPKQCLNGCFQNETTKKHNFFPKKSFEQHELRVCQRCFLRHSFWHFLFHTPCNKNNFCSSPQRRSLFKAMYKAHLIHQAAGWSYVVKYTAKLSFTLPSAFWLKLCTPSQIHLLFYDPAYNRWKCKMIGENCTAKLNWTQGINTSEMEHRNPYFYTVPVELYLSVLVLTWHRFLVPIPSFKHL